MQYQGGKSRIASEIATKIRSMYPTENVIYEPFCGGGAMTLALAKVGFTVMASDSHPDLILMWQALMRGESEPFRDVTEEEYASLKKAQPSARRGFVGFGASFGGGFFAGFARRPYDPTRNIAAETRRNIQRLVGLSISFAIADYLQTPDDALVYADPPYYGTKAYKGTSFDHAQFWTWVLERTGPTFVSELDAPEFMEVVWSKQHKSQNASNSPTTKATSKIVEREERLFYKPRS